MPEVPPNPAVPPPDIPPLPLEPPAPPADESGTGRHTPPRQAKAEPSPQSAAPKHSATHGVVSLGAPQPSASVTRHCPLPPQSSSSTQLVVHTLHQHWLPS